MMDLMQWVEAHKEQIDFWERVGIAIGLAFWTCKFSLALLYMRRHKKRQQAKG